MRGLLRKTGAGIAASLVDAWGFEFELTGTAVPGGYDVEIKCTHTPSWLELPGDGEPAPVKRTPMDTKKLPAPKPGKSKMIGSVCPDCGRAHGGEACGHDARKSCAGCGNPVGLLTPRMTSGDVCWKCVRAGGGET